MAEQASQRVAPVRKQRKQQRSVCILSLNLCKADRYVAADKFGHKLRVASSRLAARYRSKRCMKDRRSKILRVTHRVTSTLGEYLDVLLLADERCMEAYSSLFLGASSCTSSCEVSSSTGDRSRLDLAAEVVAFGASRCCRRRAPSLSVGLFSLSCGTSVRAHELLST